MGISRGPLSRVVYNRSIPLAIQYRPETEAWEWQVNVIDDPKTLNAWCMAGGRMAIYTGIIQQLKLTDDEIAQMVDATGGKGKTDFRSTHPAGEKRIEALAQLAPRMMPLYEDKSERAVYKFKTLSAK